MPYRFCTCGKLGNLGLVPPHTSPAIVISLPTKKSSPSLFMDGRNPAWQDRPSPRVTSLESAGSCVPLRWASVSMHFFLFRSVATQFRRVYTTFCRIAIPFRCFALPFRHVSSHRITLQLHSATLQLHSVTSQPHSVMWN